MLNAGKIAVLGTEVEYREWRRANPSLVHRAFHAKHESFVRGLLISGVVEISTPFERGTPAPREVKEYRRLREAIHARMGRT